MVLAEPDVPGRRSNRQRAVVDASDLRLSANHGRDRGDRCGASSSVEGRRMHHPQVVVVPGEADPSPDSGAYESQHTPTTAQIRRAAVLGRARDKSIAHTRNAGSKSSDTKSTSYRSVVPNSAHDDQRCDSETQDHKPGCGHQRAALAAAPPPPHEGDRKKQQRDRHRREDTAGRLRAQLRTPSCIASRECERIVCCGLEEGMGKRQRDARRKQQIREKAGRNPGELVERRVHLVDARELIPLAEVREPPEAHMVVPGEQQSAQDEWPQRIRQ